MKFFISIISVITDSISEDGIVFLFHIAIIIFLITSGACKSNMIGLTIIKQMRVYKLAPIVRVNAQ